MQIWHGKSWLSRGKQRLGGVGWEVPLEAVLRNTELLLRFDSGHLQMYLLATK